MQCPCVTFDVASELLKGLPFRFVTSAIAGGFNRLRGVAFLGEPLLPGHGEDGGFGKDAAGAARHAPIVQLLAPVAMLGEMGAGERGHGPSFLAGQGKVSWVVEWIWHKAKMWLPSRVMSPRGQTGTDTGG